MSPPQGTASSGGRTPVIASFGKPRAETPPLRLASSGLEGARLALARPERPRAKARRVLAYAALTAVAALALCAVVVWGGASPQSPDASTSSVRAPLGLRPA